MVQKYLYKVPKKEIFVVLNILRQGITLENRTSTKFSAKRGIQVMFNRLL